MMLFEWKPLFPLTNLGKKVKGPTSLVARKETNILASIDVTVLGKCGQVQSPGAVMCPHLFMSWGKSKRRWIPH